MQCHQHAQKDKQDGLFHSFTKEGRVNRHSKNVTKYQGQIRTEELMWIQQEDNKITVFKLNEFIV